MYNTTILRLIQILSGTAATPVGWSAGLFGGTYFAQSYFADAWGGLGNAAVSQVYELALVGVG